jgi:DNA repair ATPase RecN
MANVNRLLKRMAKYLEKENKNINQFYHTSRHTITELYRTEAYVEQLKAIIKRLESLLKVDEKYRKSACSKASKTEEYSKLINEISTELHFLKATNDAMEENLDEINKSDYMQHKISVRIMDLKEKIYFTIVKAERILLA